MKKIALISMLALWAFAPAVAQEQPFYVTGENATGVTPFGSYAGLRENIDLNNLNLNISIPLFTFRGRAGMDFTATLVYNSTQREWVLHTTRLGIEFYTLDQVRNPASQISSVRTGPILEHILGRFTLPGGAERFQNRYVLRMPDDSRIEFVNKDFDNFVDAPTEASLERFRSLGGSYMELRELVNRDRVEVLMHDGTTIRFERSGSQLLPQWIRDRNGNRITFGSNGVTESLGRSFTGNSFTDPATGDKVSELTVKNGDGTDVVYTLRRNDPTTRQTLTLPNGLQYVLEYTDLSVTLQSPVGANVTSTHKRLTKITYPSGGHTRYVWGTGFNQSRVVLTDKYVDDGTGEVRFRYSDDPATRSRQVTLPTGDFTRHFFDTQTIQRQGLEDKVEFYDSASTLLRTVVKDWESPFGDPQQIRETVILHDVSPNLHKKTEFVYDRSGYLKGALRTSNGNVIEEREYNWGNHAPGALLKRTRRTFHSGFPYGVDHRHILGLRTQEIIDEGAASAQVRSDFFYDEYTSPFSLISASGAVQRDSSYGASFTQRGNPSRIVQHLTNGADPVVRFRYDIFGNIREEIDPRSFKATTSFTSATQFAYPTRITDAEGFVKDFAYDFNNSTKRGFGYLIRQTDVSNGSLDTTFSYDVMGRLVRSDSPDGGRQLRFYSDLDLTAVHNGAPVFNERGTGDELPPRIKTFTLIESGSPALERIETSVFDGLGRSQLAAVSNGTSRDWRRTEYDSLGRVDRVSNEVTLPTLSDQPSPINFTRWTTNRYDALDRVIEVVPPDGQAVTTLYQGRSTTVTDQLGHKRRSSSDGSGRVFQVRESNPSTGLLGAGSLDTFYEYDVLDNLTKVTQGAQVRDFVFDSLGRLVSEIHPESGTTTYAFDIAGNLLRKTDARGVRTDYSGYDGLNRLGGVSYSDGTPPLSFSYDSPAASHGKGRLTGRSDAVGSESFDYDPIGRIGSHERSIDGVTLRMDYAYNEGGGVTSTAYPGILDGSIPLTVFQEFDNTGRPVSSRWSNGTSAMQELVDNYTFFHSLSTGLATETFDYANGTIETVTYNGRRQPRVRKVRRGAATLMHLEYTYARPGDNRNNGNIFSVIDHVDAGRDQHYAYDFLNRLRDASSPGAWNHSYGYDRYGNLLSRVATGSGLPSMSLSISTSSNRITAAGYNYDSAGHQIARPGSSFQWDGQGRLRSVDHGATATYAYDAENRRVKKTASGQTRLYFYDKDGNAVWEYLVGAPFPWETFNYYFQGRLAVINSAAATAAPLWVHSDHLSTPRVKTNASSAVVSREWHFPFGVSLASSGDQVKTGFAGNELDAETDLLYFGARFQAPSLGRFLSPDPAKDQFAHNPQSWNLYAYTRNNPVRAADIGGEITPWDVADVAMFGLSLRDFIREPSFKNFGFLAADAAGLLPVVPSLGLFRRGAKLFDRAASLNKVGRGAETTTLRLLEKRGFDTILAGQDAIKTFFGISLKADGVKTADFIARKGNRFTIVESKASDIDTAIKQLDNTASLVKSISGAKIGSLQIVISSVSKLGPKFKIVGNQLLRMNADGKFVPVRIQGKAVTVVVI